MARRALSILGLALGLAACGSEDANTGADALSPNYTQHIAPILQRACVPCHTSDGLRAGGVELDAYDSAKATAVKDACTAVTPDLITAYADVLKPVPRTDAPDRATCADWAPFSMPPAALDKLTPFEQVLLLRWIETGAPQ